jgi:succinate dehydrogenase / fumarate reductase iron-sulfur subunit
MSGSHGETINVTLKVWRQTSADAPGGFETHQQAISTDASFLEMLDLLNEELNAAGKEPIAFESDCREGICGTCGVMINGRAHGPQKATATCQLHMREFADGDEIVIEPFRAAGFPVIRDLAVDRSPLDAIIEAGGYISVNTGHLGLLPQGQAERWSRTEAMVETMEEFFGSCTNHGECTEACPKEISLDFIALMNRDYMKAKVKNRALTGQH